MFDQKRPALAQPVVDNLAETGLEKSSHPKSKWHVKGEICVRIIHIGSKNNPFTILMLFGCEEFGQSNVGWELPAQILLGRSL